MRWLLYAPYGYAVFLLVVGFVSSRRFGKDSYFWGALALAELSRLGQVLFLVQNFGQPIYLMGVRGLSVSLDYRGVYLSGVAASIALLGGLLLYWRQKRFFPGLWLLIGSLGELLILGVLRVML
ncbi:MAG: hypothetical protein N2170_06080 [Bacteroidia bacterium]|nr:hypothetical protein [Bacteroidia bacterium]